MISEETGSRTSADWGPTPRKEKTLPGDHWLIQHWTETGTATFIHTEIQVSMWRFQIAHHSYKLMFKIVELNTLLLVWDILDYYLQIKDFSLFFMLLWGWFKAEQRRFYTFGLILRNYWLTFNEALFSCSGSSIFAFGKNQSNSRMHVLMGQLPFTYGTMSHINNGETSRQSYTGHHGGGD